MIPNSAFDAPRNDSSSSIISADGRYVVFTSAATDLVAGVSGLQVYVRDLLKGTTTLVSVNRDGTGGGNDTSLVGAAISGDGRYVVFSSYASDLVERDTNGEYDIFVRDLVAGKTSLVTINRAGTDSGKGNPRLPNGSPDKPPFFSYYQMMSTDGRRIFFLSYADDLVENDTNNTLDFFVRDMQTGTTSCVNVNRAGLPDGNRTSLTTSGTSGFDPVISADGRYAAFVSYSNDLVDNDTVCDGTCTGKNGLQDVFVRDVVANKTTLVSVNRTGTNSGNGLSSDPSISADGQIIAFRSFATDLVENDVAPQADIYARDMRKGLTTLVSVNMAGTAGGSVNGNNVNQYNPLVSGNGRYVAFSSAANDLAPNKKNIFSQDVFVRDLTGGTTTLVSVNRAGDDGSGRPANTTSIPWAFSYDGRFLVFDSRADDLIAGDTNNDLDEFVRDLTKNTTIPLAINRAGEFSGVEGSSQGRISADGRILVFASAAPDLVDNDKNNTWDIFVRPLFETNPVEDASFFVAQHYRDFLNRQPDNPGLAFWTGEITKCGADPKCLDRQRVNTSGAFFLSTEFQSTGYFVYRLYKGALSRMPQYAELMAESRQVASGVVVDDRLSADMIERNKTAYANRFLSRADFKAIYDPLDNQSYVDKLFLNVGVNVSAADKAALVSGLAQGTETRATILRKVCDGTITQPDGTQQFSTPYGKAFYEQELNRAFVLMQYFGYLRRDIDQAGYDFWLAKLDHYGNFLDAEMVRSFIVSDEYKRRFGQ